MLSPANSLRKGSISQANLGRGDVGNWVISQEALRKERIEWEAKEKARSGVLDGLEPKGTPLRQEEEDTLEESGGL